MRIFDRTVRVLVAGLILSLGAITGPALTLIPPALAAVARTTPKLRVELHVESSDVLLEQLAAGKIDIMIGRLFERVDKIDLQYERLAEEPVSAVVRPGHPLLGKTALGLPELTRRSWIVPPHGSVLRERFDEDASLARGPAVFGGGARPARSGRRVRHPAG